jgi:hypothetical protein
MAAEVERLVINQDAATSFIHIQMLAVNQTIHNIRKVVNFKGAHHLIRGEDKFLLMIIKTIPS